MPVKSDREYRFFSSFEPSGENEPYTVRGYASTFDEYVLFEAEDGTQYKERIEPTAFDGADLSDVVFLFNHEGRVFARLKNGTLQLGTDEKGLWVKADLSSTDGSRQMYEDIRTGLVDQMSFAFTVAPDGDSYDSDTHTRVISRMKKLYDVSAVTFPANPNTSISARSWVDGVIEQERAERLEAERKAEEREKVLALLELEKARARE